MDVGTWDLHTVPSLGKIIPVLAIFTVVLFDNSLRVSVCAEHSHVLCTGLKGHSTSALHSSSAVDNIIV